MEVTWEKHRKSENDSNSWVDSGAGESISENDIQKSPLSGNYSNSKKPSFKTFVDEIDDRCSIEIFDGNQFVPSYYQ